jgi:hypothetical protein
LFVVRQAGEPVGKLVGALDVPRHGSSMPREALCVKGYIWSGAGRAPADEDKVIEHGAEQPDDSLVERTIGVNHAATP